MPLLKHKLYPGCIHNLSLLHFSPFGPVASAADGAEVLQQSDERAVVAVPVASMDGNKSGSVAASAVAADISSAVGSGSAVLTEPYESVAAGCDDPSYAAVVLSRTEKPHQLAAGSSSSSVPSICSGGTALMYPCHGCHLVASCVSSKSFDNYAAAVVDLPHYDVLSGLAVVAFELHDRFGP